MAFTPISNTVPQYEENGVAASGYFIKFYESGTTTPTAMATDSTGTTLLDKCELNTEGYPINSSSAVFIPHINKKYKIALFRNAADADANDLASAAWPAVDGLLPVVTVKTTFVEGIDSVADIEGFVGVIDDQQTSLKGWHPGSDVGGGILYWDSSSLKSDHNGGTVFSPTVPFSVNTSDYLDGVGETDTGGTGCWVRKSASSINIDMFGAVPQVGSDSFAAIQKAVSSGVMSVIIPPKTYYSSGAVELSSNISVEGSGYFSRIVSTGVNKRVFYANGQVGITVEKLFIKGNLSGVGSTSAGDSGGEGIFLYDCENSVVTNCYFDSIGNDINSSFSGCAVAHTSNKIQFVNNYFLDNNISSTGYDIGFGYYCHDVIVSNNISVSEMDTFISGASVGVSVLDTANHTITGNLGKRSDGSAARTGILIPYNGKPAYASITGNTLVNFPANGIYVSAGATDEGTDSAGISVSGNVVRFCGGAEWMQNISAGIYLSGRGGVSCTGNIVSKTGLRSDGTSRFYAVEGIRVTNTSKNITISGNTVLDGTGYGVGLLAGSGSMQSILLSGNTISSNAGGGILVRHTGASSDIDGISITSNIVNQSEVGGNGVYIEQSGTIITGALCISGNTILGAGISTDNGILSNVSGMINWSIVNNTIRDFNRGISMISGAIADKEVGYNCIVDSNILERCTTGVHMAISTGKYSLFYNTAFIDCTSNFTDQGRMFNAIRLDGRIIQVNRAAAFTEGVWDKGCRVMNTNISSGQPMGWVCSSTGSPGSWLAMPSY